MYRYKARYFGLLAALLAIPAFTCGIGPALRQLTQRVDALEVEIALVTELTETLRAGLEALVARVDVIEEAVFFEPSEAVLLDDDFEDGIDPGWVQVYGTSPTIAPTGNCTQAYFSQYANCGSLGLYFDEPERYDFYLPSTRGERPTLGPRRGLT